MTRLNKNGNNYIINSPRPFNGTPIPKDRIEKVKEFAYAMCFGEGHHRLHRTGGQYDRRAGEQFCNTFQGKLAEVVLRDCLISHGLPCDEPDFGVYGEGVWDDTDLIVNGKTISVKSAAHFSNLLLLETKDYDSLGNYLPNLNIGATACYDFYVLVRICPDIKGIFKKNRIFFKDDIAKETIDNIIATQQWLYDIAGCISHRGLIEMINHGYIIPQNAMLNGSTRMDAENYYAQAGDMSGIDRLCEKLSQ